MPTAVASPSKIVLITGVSRGLGRALALELARRGHTIVGCARSAENVAALREKLEPLPKASSHPHFFTTADVSSDAAVQDLAKQVVEAELLPDIIVNNAGVINKNNDIWDLSAEEIDLVVDVNIKGTINVLRHFLPILIKRGQGVIVNMSSVAGRGGFSQLAPYCTTKWGIEGLTRSVSMEVPQGVAVVSLDPGGVETDMLVSCCGSRAAEYPNPETWAPKAADMILDFTTKENGKTVILQLQL